MFLSWLQCFLLLTKQSAEIVMRKKKKEIVMRRKKLYAEQADIYWHFIQIGGNVQCWCKDREMCAGLKLTWLEFEQVFE